jgi:hypothetical protein
MIERVKLHIQANYCIAYDMKSYYCYYNNDITSHHIIKKVYGFRAMHASQDRLIIITNQCSLQNRKYCQDKKPSPPFWQQEPKREREPPTKITS